jgi:hypothetical protein
VRYLLRNALYAEEVASDIRAFTDPKAGGRPAAGEREGRVGLAAIGHVERVKAGQQWRIRERDLEAVVVEPKLTRADAEEFA